MGEYAQEGDARDSRENRKRGLSDCNEAEDGRAEELGEVDQEMGPSGMKAMAGEVRWGCIVEEVIDGSDYRCSLKEGGKRRK